MVGLGVQQTGKQTKINRMVGVIIFVVSATALLSWSWVRGIDYMKENHPDYKGEDLFDEDLDSNNDITKMAGRDGWDDNKVHSEGDIW
jgi:hypothetical protein